MAHKIQLSSYALAMYVHEAAPLLQSELFSSPSANEKPLVAEITAKIGNQVYTFQVSYGDEECRNVVLAAVQSRQVFRETLSSLAFIKCFLDSSHKNSLKNRQLRALRDLSQQKDLTLFTTYCGILEAHGEAQKTRDAARAILHPKMEKTSKGVALYLIDKTISFIKKHHPEMNTEQLRKEIANCIFFETKNSKKADIETIDWDSDSNSPLLDLVRGLQTLQGYFPISRLSTIQSLNKSAQEDCLFLFSSLLGILIMRINELDPFVDAEYFELMKQYSSEHPNLHEINSDLLEAIKDVMETYTRDKIDLHFRRMIYSDYKTSIPDRTRFFQDVQEFLALIQLLPKKKSAAIMEKFAYHFPEAMTALREESLYKLERSGFLDSGLFQNIKTLVDGVLNPPPAPELAAEDDVALEVPGVSSAEEPVITRSEPSPTAPTPSNVVSG